MPSVVHPEPNMSHDPNSKAVDCMHSIEAQVRGPEGSVPSRTKVLQGTPTLSSPPHVEIILDCRHRVLSALPVELGEGLNLRVSVDVFSFSGFTVQAWKA